MITTAIAIALLAIVLTPRRIDTRPVYFDKPTIKRLSNARHNRSYGARGWVEARP